MSFVFDPDAKSVFLDENDTSIQESYILQEEEEEPQEPTDSEIAQNQTSLCSQHGIEKPAVISADSIQRTVEDMCTLIFKTIGPGSKEKVYQKALEQMLHNAGIVALSEKAVPIYFNGSCVAVGYADIVVQNRLVVELKATASTIQISHVNQCRQYMRCLRIERGLVVNFPQHQSSTTKNVEIFDCRLGVAFSTRSISKAEREKIDSGILGPAPPKRTCTTNGNTTCVEEDILSYEKYQQPYESDLHQFIEYEKFTNECSSPEKKTRATTSSQLFTEKLQKRNPFHSNVHICNGDVTITNNF